jgi:hypothetical protein
MPAGLICKLYPVVKLPSLACRWRSTQVNFNHAHICDIQMN